MTIKLDIRVNLAFTNRNWATGKTHIDSALQTLKKGLSALLDMIVAALKVIAKVASMLMDIVGQIIKKILKPILKPIEKAYNAWREHICLLLAEIAKLVRNSGLSREDRIDTDRKIESIASEFVCVTTAASFVIILSVLATAIAAIQIAISGFFGIVGGGVVINLIGELVFKTVIEGAIKSVLMYGASLTIGFILGEVIKPESTWGSFGENLFTTIGIFFITYYLQVFLAKYYKIPVPKNVKDADILGLKLALVGFFIGSIGAFLPLFLSNLNIQITYITQLFLNLLIATFGFIISFIGAFIAITNTGWSDSIPGIGGKIDEIIDAGLVGYALAKYYEADKQFKQELKKLLPLIPQTG